MKVDGYFKTEEMYLISLNKYYHSVNTSAECAVKYDTETNFTNYFCGSSEFDSIFIHLFIAGSLYLRKTFRNQTQKHRP